MNSNPDSESHGIPHTISHSRSDLLICGHDDNTVISDIVIIIMITITNVMFSFYILK